MASPFSAVFCSQTGPDARAPLVQRYILHGPFPGAVIGPPRTVQDSGADASREIFPVLRHFGRERNILVFHGLVEVLHRVVIAVVGLVSVCVIAHGAAAPGGLLPALIGGICLLDRIAAVRLVGIGAGPDPLQLI